VGGAILNDVGNLIVNDCAFTNNSATMSGGAIFNNDNLNISNSNFTNNFATGYNGAVHNQDILTVNNCNFIGNKAGNGAALTNTAVGTMTVQSSTFTGNNANANAIIANYGTTDFNFNRIANNAVNSLTIGNGGTLNGEFNWWGDNNGPVGKISGLTVNKWMVLKLNALPSTFQSNSYSKVTADLRYDNTGTLHKSTYLPNGIQIIFKSTLGTFSSTTATINGIAQTILRSVTLGSGNVTAKLDNQTMKTTVKIIDTIAPKVTSTTPKNNLINVPKTVIITIKFSENFKTSTNFNNIVVKNLSTNKNLSLSRSISGNTLTIKTSTKNANTTYQVTIPKSAIKDYAGNNLSATYTFKFKTGS